MKNKSTLLLVAGLVVLAAAVSGYFIVTQRSHSGDHHAYTSATAEQSDNTQSANIRMDIKDFAYEMPNIKIKQGTTVTWTNQDTTRHNVMEEHGGNGASHEAVTVSEVRNDVFSGPVLAKGESYSFTFTATGDFPYHCAPHERTMTGNVTVVE